MIRRLELPLVRFKALFFFKLFFCFHLWNCFGIEVLTFVTILLGILQFLCPKWNKKIVKISSYVQTLLRSRETGPSGKYMVIVLTELVLSILENMFIFCKCSDGWHNPIPILCFVELPSGKAMSAPLQHPTRPVTRPFPAVKLYQVFVFSMLSIFWFS